MANSKEKLSQIETQEIPKKSVTHFDYKWPIQAFIEDKIDWNLEYFKNISLENKWKDFMDFLEKADNDYDHSIIKNFWENKNVYLQKLNYLINYQTFPIYDLIKNLEKLFIYEYNLDDKQKKELNKKIISSSQSELSRIYYSQIKRRNFLINQVWIKKEDLENQSKVVTKDEEKILENIFSNPGIIHQINNNKELQLKILSIYNMNSTVYVEDIKWILGYLDKKSQLEFIQYFIPSISIAHAKWLKLIDDNKINDFIDKKIKEFNNLLTDDEVQKIKTEVDLSRLYLDTNELEWNKIDLLDDSNQILQSITDEFNLNKLESNEILWLQDFKSFCKASKDLSQSLKEEINSNFSVWSYLTITKKDESWNDKTFYFYIKNISTTWVELVNVTKLYWISSSNTWTAKIHTYQELFQLLNKSQSNNAFVSIQKNETIQNDSELSKIPEKNEIKSRKDLEDALNELDPKWQNIPLEKMAFKFPKGKNDKNNDFDENFFSVTYNEVDNSIRLDSWEVFAWENLSIFLEAFEQNKCTRFERIDTVTEFLDTLSTVNENFKDIIFKDWKLIPKDAENLKDYSGINLLVGKDQKKDQTILIDKIEDDKITFSMWEYKEWNKDKNEPNVFEGKKYGKNMNYTDFFMLIKKRDLTPKKQPVEEAHEEHHGEHIHGHRSLFTSWMSNFWSITEIMKWVEQMIHTIEHNLETGNKVKAAKAALFFGKFLPYHLRVELQSEVENSEKETMEKIKKELTWVDSKVMFPMILHILENKSAPQYEIEAAMFAVLKYGSLYPKDLAKYRGSYMWFEKLWGHKSMIPKLTEDALKDDPNLVITEEALIQTLLGQQADGKIKPKRRSKIHKDFGGAIQEGLSKENGDGERETSLKMTADWRISYIMWEFKWSTFANGIGWMENVWAMWPDPAWKMNTIPFVIMASGLSLDLHQSLIKKLKTFWGTTPYNSLALCTSKSWVELYQKYLERVIELYSWGTKTKMYEAFQKAKKWSDSWKISVSMKNFWDTYGETLYPVINMNDGFVVTKMNQKDNEVLKMYYEKIKWIVTDDGFSAKEDAIEEWFYDQGNSTVAVTWGLLSKIKLWDGGTFTSKSSKKILAMHMDSMTEITNNKELDKDEENRFEFFKQSYMNLERDVFSKIQPFLKRWWIDGYKDYQIVVAMSKKGFEIFPYELNENNEAKYSEMIKKVYDNLKNKPHQEEENEIFWQKLKVERSIDEILDGLPTSDKEQSEA